MTRLHLIVEGQTERRFFENVLCGHLADFGVYADARCVETSRDERLSIKYSGGITDYEKPRKDILSWMKEDDNGDSWFTTMFDLYALRSEFPAFDEAQRVADPYERVKILEAGMASDFSGHPRFIPYIQLHEFEALLLSEPQKLCVEYFERDDEIAELVALVASVKDENPELINGGEDTAPSKRIIKLIPEYKRQKATVGVQVAKEIGLETLRGKCRHFREWVSRLESLGSSPCAVR